MVTSMQFTDKTLPCKECAKEFVFSAGEQEFFSSKGLANEPKRCSDCRLVLRARRNGSDPARIAEVSCAECGSLTRVPFQPKGYRPVYCACCFQNQKAQQTEVPPAIVEGSADLPASGASSEQ
jgi:CxxC-x17-CxxC domain-containing protein